MQCVPGLRCTQQLRREACTCSEDRRLHQDPCKTQETENLKRMESKIMAIVEQTHFEQDSYTDNTSEFLSLMLLKTCLDLGASMYLWDSKPQRSFLNMCSISIIVVDLIFVGSMAATLWLEVHTAHTALCFIMAHFSAAYSAFPVPMLCLGILDYYLHWADKKCIRLVRNPVSVSLLWIISGIYAIITANSTLQRQESNVVCEIQESKGVACSVVALTALVFIVLLPYLPMIPQWAHEADQFWKAREENPEAKTSDRLTTVAAEDITWTKGDCAMPRPSMHISIILAFGIFWMPYLAVTMFTVVFAYGIPAYISVNVLWVQCMNSLMAGTVFWLGSNTVGPYSSLPDNVCYWKAYWHLSTGPVTHQQLPPTVFNPSEVKGSIPFYV